MEVLIVKVVGDDAYFKLGIVSLVIEQWNDDTKRVHVVPDDATTFHLSFDFHEEIVGIHAAYFTGISYLSDFTNSRWEYIYTPFNCRRNTLSQIEVKIAKILAISNWKIPKILDLANLIVYNDIKRYQQLSSAEFMIMTLIGQGEDCHFISKKMNRSIKTVRTHYRSASRKLGFDNQAYFFRFAKYISKNSHGAINTLCL